MSREWKPGDVAWYDNLRVMFVGDLDGDHWFVDSEGDQRWVTPKAMDLAGVSPLVVIDPEAREQVERLARAYWEHGDWGGLWIDEQENDRRTVIDGIQGALREFANPKPPRPEEPPGLGAVVEDDRGVRWVRTESAKGVENPWQATLHAAEPDRIRRLRWAEVQAVRVLSEGVPA